MLVNIKSEVFPLIFTVISPKLLTLCHQVQRKTSLVIYYCFIYYCCICGTITCNIEKVNDDLHKSYLVAKVDKTCKRFACHTYGMSNASFLDIRFYMFQNVAIEINLKLLEETNHTGDTS